MAGKGGGISGGAVAAAAVGGLLIWAGIQDAPLVDALRQITKGQAPTGRAAKTTTVQWASNVGAGVGSAVGEAAAAGAGGAIVAAARKYLGRPYKWAAVGPDSFDCSGLVYRVLNDVGIKAPRLTTWGYQAWSGAITVKRADARAGDMVIYNGHMGIMVSAGRMIHAPSVGKPVQEGNIYDGQGGPVFRRVK